MVYDLIVLGGGPAGYLACERAAEAGMQVLCVEKRSLGGVCLNEGCIPTKTLLYSAKICDNARDGEKYGVTASATIDHEKVVARKDKVVRTLVSGVKALLKAKGVTVLEGRGKIRGKEQEGYAVQVGNETHIGRQLLIATGSIPVVPSIPGVAEGMESGLVLTNREALSLKAPPKNLVVIGGGVIGLEMASYFNSVGTEVAVVEMLDHIAGENDPELVSLLQQQYEKKGIRFYLNAKVTAVEEAAVLCVQNGAALSLPADAVLLSIGRRANTAELGLPTLGVELERGAIITDSHMRTNIPGVYAAGDVNGKSMLAHTAYREAEVAVNHMLGKKDCMRYSAIPAVLYTNPELASVGETEHSARAKGLDIEVVSIPMRLSGRYLAENEGGNGICKLVFDRNSQRLLGAQALSNYSSEFIVAAGTFIELALPKETIQKLVFPHPTVSEILREAMFQ